MASKLDTGPLEAFARRLENLPRVRQQVARRISQELMPDIMERQFDRRRGPMGKQWARPKGHRRGEYLPNPPMERTGKLRAGFRWSAHTTGDGVVVSCTNTQAYWWYLQQGNNGPEALDVPFRRRQTMADPGQRPREWIEGFLNIYEEEYIRHFERSVV